MHPLRERFCFSIYALFDLLSSVGKERMSGLFFGSYSTMPDALSLLDRILATPRVEHQRPRKKIGELSGSNPY
jgi:hypothetical protein